MKIIQYINNVVVDIRTVRNDATNENIVVVEDVPKFEPKEGFKGILKYGEDGLYWDHEKVIESDELSAEEAFDIIFGGEV